MTPKTQSVQSKSTTVERVTLTHPQMSQSGAAEIMRRTNRKSQRGTNWRHTNRERQQRSHQVYHQNHRAPYYQEHQARTPPRWQVEEQANDADAKDMARVQKLEDQVASLRKNLDSERQRASSFLQEREVSRNMFQVLLRKERKQVRDLYAEKCSLEEQVKKLQEDAYKRAMEGSKNKEEIQELSNLVESLSNKLEAEMLRAKTLEKEHEGFRSSVQEEAKQEMKKMEQLEAEKLSLEDEVKKLRENVYSRAMEGSKNTEKIQELNDLVSSLSNKLEAEMLKTGNLQTQLDEAKLQLLEENNQELQLDDGMDEEKDILETTADDLLMETSENEDQEETFEVIGEDIREPSPELDNTLVDSEEDGPHTVLETREMTLPTPEVIAEATELESSSGEDIREPSPELDNTLVDSEEDGPHTVQETPEMTLPTPEVIAEATELESISLWRRFKKAMTPKDRRKYKRQRQD
ncbi:kinectin-like [Xyrichtys novacula]|uniref:Kinectin-like n=1 Tax=Xyrichtys novacula TaxID=13765 RepID=A0AAV1FV72_XYRNO|nr:kinectin-like [Xyrichtys novacula]